MTYDYREHLAKVDWSRIGELDAQALYTLTVTACRSTRGRCFCGSHVTPLAETWGPPTAESPAPAPALPWDEGGRDAYYSSLPGDDRLVAGLPPAPAVAVAEPPNDYYCAACRLNLTRDEARSHQCAPAVAEPWRPKVGSDALIRKSGERVHVAAIQATAHYSHGSGDLMGLDELEPAPDASNESEKS